MKKAVVSGATGFVGGAVVNELIKQGVEVFALGLETEKGKIIETEQLHYISFDLADAYALEKVFPKQEIDVFYHFAWVGSAGSMRADTRMQLNNAQWTIDCIKVARAIGCKRFVNAGSIMELETFRAMFAEENKPGMAYIYGAGKLVAHAMCKSVAAEVGIDLIWGMITNAYGVGELSPRMVNVTLQKCIRGENPQFTAGTQNYDFVYIDDVARAFYCIGEKGHPFNHYVIGSSSARPLKEFLLEMQAAVAPDLEFIFGDIPYTGVMQPLEDFDCSKTELDTGFKAEISFGEGCKKTYEWLKGRI